MGEANMKAYADEIFKSNLRLILEEGVWDSGHSVRPRWEDGEPAHTKYVTGVFNTYDIYKMGLPITTLRKVAWKTALKEILWIYQDKSNDVNFLKEKYGVKYWEAWKNKKGNLGTSYAHQLAKEIEFPEGTFDQVDRVLHLIKNDPMNRRIITNMLNLEEMKDMTLAPCAFMTQWSIRGPFLDLTLIQRSNDVIAAQSINVIQYAFLLYMIASATGYIPGKLNHYINNMLKRESQEQPKFEMIYRDDFYKFTPDDFRVKKYRVAGPQLSIPIAE
jgi:thymidylate synthase